MTCAGTLRESTTIKRKACSIPLGLYLGRDGSTSKQRRLASQVHPLLQEELHGRWFTYGNFLADFVHYGPWALGNAQTLDFLALLSRDTVTTGITFDSVSNNYRCTPPGFADAQFPAWFCGLVNAIQRVSQGDTGTLGNICATDSTVGGCVPASPDTTQSTCSRRPSNPRGPSWISSWASALQGLGKPQIRPDFVLTNNPTAPTWSNILVVGEHHSAGKTEETAKLQLASYVEQVFIAQPFRVAMIGILTSNTSTTLRLWRFDRAGAVGSLKLDYSSSASSRGDLASGDLTSGDLISVVQCLYSLTQRQLHATWFHTKGISWTSPKQPDWCIVEPTKDERAMEEVLLNERLFIAGGIVSRGTCVWKATLRATGQVIVVKYTWRSTKRTSEAKIYSVALAQGVVGLPQLVSHDEYNDIHMSIRKGVIPCTMHDPANPTPAEKSAVDAYISFAMNCNRSLTRLVLGTIGKPISDPSLSPLEIGRSLLAGLIVHASLFFQAGILHRDVSVNNIISVSSPLATMPRTPPAIAGNFLYTPGTDLYGSLIDLDYATVLAEQETSRIPERTGTYPFIAIAILQGSVIHRYRHDLESFLYVLLWVSCYPVAGTRSSTQAVPLDDIRQQERWPPDDPLCSWSYESEEIVASLKIANIVNDEEFFEELLERFRPGFDAFKTAAREMRLALWELHDTGICSMRKESTGTEEGHAGAGRKRKKAQSLGAGEVRIGVGNWEAFCEFRRILEELVHEL